MSLWQAMCGDAGVRDPHAVIKISRVFATLRLLDGGDFDDWARYFAIRFDFLAPEPGHLVQRIGINLSRCGGLEGYSPPEMIEVSRTRDADVRIVCLQALDVGGLGGFVEVAVQLQGWILWHERGGSGPRLRPFLLPAQQWV